MIDHPALFQETQQFRQTWLWLIIIGADLLVLVVVLYPFLSTTSESRGNYYQLLLLLIPGFLTWFFTRLKLETKINSLGILIRFYPLQLSFKEYSWENIMKSKVVTYNPLLDFGGWGIRWSLFGKGKAYNVAGNKGLQLVFNNHSKLLIGTQKPEEMESVLSAIHKIYG